ncbi:hypothetical protein CDO52_21540 [Nocardiopsis gilva YIM 90087]|uniref:Transposase IS4-like domain-containing protein n=1 Tax=Nocardiopsis gilva YIM 90087 TaxID=1235441 RepID=A0A223SA81_9ACTN|nr:hypothetical protein [Nocardiopsis gilva]ASU85032.1 hypothetical protein CDO52_21540 [Nocardiopsis gilva YIM 90087]
MHLSETCDEDAPHLITHVATTPTTVTDVEMAEPVYAILAAKGLLAPEHLVDRGYVSAELLATSVDRHGVEVGGPIREGVTWQGRARSGGRGRFVRDRLAGTAGGAPRARCAPDAPALPAARG